MKLIHLITTGRKTGKQHECELYAFDHEDKLVITASAGGSNHHPDWFLNLRADPRVQVRLGKKEYAAKAQETDPELRKQLWSELIRQSPMYDGYRKKTNRVIPMVLLTLEDK
jgi:deazaflavin-dependent oxidoreductase (nitroreductase family)